MARIDYINKYRKVIQEINSGTPYRKISRMYGIGLTTVQRLANMRIYRTPYEPL